jgi:hypothetical protein
MSFWKGLRIEILEAVKPRKLFIYSITVVIFSIVSFILPYDVQVSTSIIAGIVMVLLLVASLVALRGFKKLDMVFISGIVFLVIALFPKELLLSSFPTLDVIRNFQHLSRIMSIALTALYVAVGIFQFTNIRPHWVRMKHFSNFFSMCNTTISSELCGCLHSIPFLDVLLAPLGVADLIINRVKLGFVIMMVTLVLQIWSSYESYRKSAGRIKIFNQT